MKRCQTKSQTSAELFLESCCSAGFFPSRKHLAKDLSGARLARNGRCRLPEVRSVGERRGRHSSPPRVPALIPALMPAPDSLSQGRPHDRPHDRPQAPFQKPIQSNSGTSRLLEVFSPMTFSQAFLKSAAYMSSWGLSRGVLHSPSQTSPSSFAAHWTTSAFSEQVTVQVT